MTNCQLDPPRKLATLDALMANSQARDLRTVLTPVSFAHSPDKAHARGSAVISSTESSSSDGSSASGEVASLDSNSGGFSRDSNNGVDSLGAPPSFTLSVLAEPREISAADV